VVTSGAELVMLVMLWVFASQSIAELLLAVRCEYGAAGMWI